MWGSLFHISPIYGLPSDTALLLVFALDILAVTNLVYLTGGSLGSPFQPLFFLMPTIALLLRESALRVISYSLVLSISYLVMLFKAAPPQSEHPKSARHALAFVTIACLFLTILIGLLTRQ